MSDMPPPLVLAIVICDQIIRDELTKKLTLIGVFSSITGPRLPVVLSSMHVYAALTGGRGELRSRIRIEHLASEQVVFEAEGPLAFRGPQQVVELNVKLPQVTFPQWGPYAVSLYAGPTFLGSRKLVVQPLPTGGTSSPPAPPTEAPSE